MNEKKLDLDELESVSGGRIKVTGFGLLRAIIVQIKALGYDKEFFIQTFMEGWETDCKFKTSFTDQTGDDLANAIDFLDKTWQQMQNDREDQFGFRRLLLLCTTD